MGIQRTYNDVVSKSECNAADGPVVVTVSVAEPPGPIELGLTEHFGASVGEG
jgi:hypothetical protein